MRYARILCRGHSADDVMLLRRVGGCGSRMIRECCVGIGRWWRLDLRSGLEVWNSYQVVQTSTDTVKDSEQLMDIAQRSFTAARHRYQAGVCNILELLNAQTALANAQ